MGKVRLGVWTVFVVIATLIASALATGAIERPLRYELTVGYRGWVLIQYVAFECVPLVGGGLGEVFVVNPDGHGCTSSPPRKGWHPATYSERIGPSLREINPEQITIHSSKPNCFREEFYVRDLGQTSIPPEPADWRFCQGFPMLPKP